MSFVLDASVTMDWCFVDESDGYSQGVLEHLRRSHAIVPALWLLEINNVLLVKERRGKLTQEGTDKFLLTLQRLDIRVRYEEIDQYGSKTLALAREHGLTVYDAIYLELAARQQLPLATRDKELIRAAPLAGVPLFSPQLLVPTQT